MTIPRLSSSKSWQSWKTIEYQYARGALAVAKFNVCEADTDRNVFIAFFYEFLRWGAIVICFFDTRTMVLISVFIITLTSSLFLFRSLYNSAFIGCLSIKAMNFHGRSWSSCCSSRVIFLFILYFVVFFFAPVFSLHYLTQVLNTQLIAPQIHEPTLESTSVSWDNPQFRIWGSKRSRMLTIFQRQTSVDKTNVCICRV